MAYQLQFGDLGQYASMFASGAAVTLGLTAVSTVLGLTVGILGAAGKGSKFPAVRSFVGGYVELIRNTPFIVQLFFIFFGLPAAGIFLSESVAAFLAMVINLGAYSTEIIRAGIEAVPKGHIEAGVSLAMTRLEVLRYIILKQAFEKIWQALSS